LDGTGGAGTNISIGGGGIKRGPDIDEGDIIAGGDRFKGESSHCYISYSSALSS
jgi:hypothetical protein